MAQAFDIYATAGAPAIILRVLQQLTAGADRGDFDDPFNDGSHLPMVQPVRELQKRVQTLDAAATKYRNKSSEHTIALQGDLEMCDDPEAKSLTENLMRSQKMLADYLEGLHPILREQLDSVKRLSEYLTPPTVELFQKKASHILKDAPQQQISMTKKNTCTICMDASADCVIKRTCSSNPTSSSHPAHQHQVRCEHDTCKCGPTMCKDCLLTHYWTSTGKGSKSYARCVCCRAEFCLKDVFPVQYVEDEAYLSQKSEQERKAKEREIAKAKEAEEEKGRTGRRSRKSSNPLSALTNNNTTTTTTTTTSSSSSSSLSPSSSSYSPSSSSSLPPFHQYIHLPSPYSFPHSYFEDLTSDDNPYGNSTHNNNTGTSNNTTSNRNKRRRTTTTSSSSSTSSSSTTTTNNNNNNTCTHNHLFNNVNNNDNDSSDTDGQRGPKYHLRSSQRRSSER